MSSAEQIENLRKLGILRRLVPSEPRGEKIIRDGAEVVNFASNDYLGVSADLNLQSEFFKTLPETSFVMGSTSSRLLGGDNCAFENLEEYFGRLYSCATGVPRSCLLFNGGFHANTGILPAVSSSGDLIVCDRLSHASILDSLKLGDAKWTRFRHNDMNHLREILIKNTGKYENIFIVSEGVFSMDGDTADIRALVELKREFGAKLYVDEAHSFGLFGNGLGICVESGTASQIDFIMCTLGKAVGSQGAILICADEDKQLVVNKCRPFIFTTALAPISALWTRFVFERILKMDDRRRHLFKISKLLRSSIKNRAIKGDTQIVPVIVGSETAASELSEMLLTRGMWAPAVRYPSVPRGEARLRISLSAAMRESSVLNLAEALNGRSEI